MLFGSGAGTRSAEALTIVPLGSGVAGSAASNADAAVEVPGHVAVQDWAWHGPSATLTVTGVVLGVIEYGGHCELAVSGEGAGVRTASSIGNADGDGTRCEVELIDIDLVGGDWDVVLEYRNGLGTSLSEPIRVRLD